MNRVDPRHAVGCHLGSRPRNNKNVFIIRRVIPDVGNFLLEVPFHAPASRRVELGQVADLHGISDFLLPTPAFRETAMISTSSPASCNKGSACDSPQRFVSTISSSQNA